MITWLIENKRTLRSFTLKEVFDIVNTIVPDLEAMEPYKTKIKDCHCGMRAIKTDALKRLNLQTTGMEFASEMIVKALKNN